MSLAPVIANTTMCSGWSESSRRSADELKQYDQVETVLITIVMPCILITGLVCNSGFIYVVLRVSWMQNIPNKYLCHLAVADIILLVNAIGEKISHYWLSPYVYDEASSGVFGCIVVQVWKFIGYYASILFVSLVAFERYIAVCRPLEKFGNNRRFVQIIAMAWIASAFLACLQIPSSCNVTIYCIMWSPTDLEANPDLPESIGYCLPANEIQNLEDFAVLIQTMTFIAALVCNAVLYFKIIRELNKRMASIGVAAAASSRQPSVRSNDSDQTLKDAHIRDRVARMLIINGTVFFLLTSPYQVIMLVMAVANEDALEEEKNFGTWMQICRILTYINSVVNPVIYGVTNARYRKAFRKAFYCQCPGNRASVSVIHPSEGK